MYSSTSSGFGFVKHRGPLYPSWSKMCRTSSGQFSQRQRNTEKSMDHRIHRYFQYLVDNSQAELRLNQEAWLWSKRGLVLLVHQPSCGRAAPFSAGLHLSIIVSRGSFSGLWHPRHNSKPIIRSEKLPWMTTQGETTQVLLKEWVSGAKTKKDMGAQYKVPLLL